MTIYAWPSIQWALYTCTFDQVMMLITTIVKNLMFLLEQNFVNVLHLQSLLIVKGLFKSVVLKKKHLRIFVLLKLAATVIEYFVHRIFVRKLIQNHF